MNNMTIGMSHPAGSSRSFSENGRSFCTIVSNDALRCECVNGSLEQPGRDISSEEW